MIGARNWRPQSLWTRSLPKSSALPMGFALEKVDKLISRQATVEAKPRTRVDLSNF